ncbi:MAG: outer membrane beta-barrel protein [Ginsengibacter sp.]
MQNLENDMDELFQRAADNYPLKNGEGDWESVAKRIADKPGPSATLTAPKNNSTKKITALFLLLFIGGISWFVFQHYQQWTEAAVPGKNVLADNIKKAESKTSATEKNNESNAGRNTSTVTYKKDKSNRNNGVGLSGNRIANAETGNVNKPVSSSIKKTNTGTKKTLGGENSNNGSPVESNNNFSSEEETDQKNIDNPPAENEISVDAILLKNNGKEELSAAGNAESAVAHNEKKKPKASQDFRKKKGIYVGLVAGTDFSKVHAGSFDHSGVNAGIIAGYRFNKKISLESGINWDKKYYTSDGKTFRMDKIASTMPSGMVINNLESNNSFVEIPLKMKFDFFTKGNNNLFVSGGVSAYIITREKNMYHVTYNGDNKDILGVYEKNNYGLPAVANISLGYEKTVFKNFDIRIEPYLKIPLRGMGVGSLPVTSAGLQIGIIGRLK